MSDLNESPDTPEEPPSEPQPETPPQAYAGVERGMAEVNVCPNCGWPNSPSRVTCKQCQTRLPVVKRPALPELPSQTRIIHFAAGFAGWYLVNLLPAALLGFNQWDEGYLITNGLCIFPANVFALIFLAVSRQLRWIALGVLAAWGVNLLISLVLGAVENAFCLVPFFIR